MEFTGDFRPQRARHGRVGPLAMVVSAAFLCTAASGTSEVCTANGQNCTESKCCSEEGSTCFKKNEHWASCNKTCDPYVFWNTETNQFEVHANPQWTCESLGTTAACTANGQNCTGSKCCSEEGSACFKKNEHWASCNKTCDAKHFWNTDTNQFEVHENPQWTCEVLVTHNHPLGLLEDTASDRGSVVAAALDKFDTVAEAVLEKLDFDENDADAEQLVQRFPSISTKLDGLDFGLVAAAGKEMVKSIKKSSVATVFKATGLAMTAVRAFHAFLRPGSVVTTVVIEPTDSSGEAALRSLLASESIANAIASAVGQIPGINAVATGPITGAAVSASAAFGGVLPGQGRANDGVLVPGASMPDTVAAANSLAFNRISAGLQRKYEQGAGERWESTWNSLGGASILVLAIVTTVVGLTKLRSSRVSVPEQIPDDVTPLIE